jgi:hypothetical protein
MGNSNGQPINDYIKDICYTPIDENPISLLLDSVKNDNLENLNKAITITAKRNNYLSHEEFKKKMYLFLNYNIKYNKSLEEVALENNSNKVLIELKRQKIRYKTNFKNDNSLDFLKNKFYFNEDNINKCSGRYE